MNNVPNTSDDKLDWLAFQYLAGELSFEETQAFERRLADDPAACEAVARAVELGDMIAACEREWMPSVAVSPSNPAPNWLAPAIAVAACVLLMLGVSTGLREPSRAVPVQLAQKLSEDIDWSLPSMDEVSNIATDDDDLVDVVTDVPSWMLDGVKGVYDETKPSPGPEDDEELDS